MKLDLKYIESNKVDGVPKWLATDLRATVESLIFELQKRMINTVDTPHPAGTGVDVAEGISIAVDHINRYFGIDYETNPRILRDYNHKPIPKFK